MTGGRCADLSEAAREPLSATATTASSWLLLERRGTWPRDVADDGGLDDASRHAVTRWLEATPSSRALFIRRPGRTGGPPVVFVVHAGEHEAEVRKVTLDHNGLAGVDLATDGVVLASQLVLVCGHGTRDPCCALRGSAVYGALREHVPADDLWLSSHQGGHRFAANVLVLPAGIQLGRVAPGNAVRIVGDAVDGRIALVHYRGRTAYTAREQAAERAVREDGRLLGVADLALVGDDGTHVGFVDASGREHRATPGRVAGPAVPASCGAEPEAQPHLAAGLVRAFPSPQIESPQERILEREDP